VTDERLTQLNLWRLVELLFVCYDDTAWEHGQEQEVKCQNSLFAFLFLLQATTLMVYGCLGVKNLIAYDPEAHDDIMSSPNHTNEHHEEEVIYRYVPLILWFFLAMAATIVLVSATVLTFLLRQTGTTKKMMEFSLILSPVSFVIMAIGSLAAGVVPLTVLFALGAAINVWYVTRVWHRIPVAAANLAVAMTAIKAHQRGLVSLGYAMTLLTVCWTCMWMLAVGQVSVMDSDAIWDCKDTDCELTTGGTWIMIGLLLSLYWTTQVIKNLFHTTVAGVVGSWWFSRTQEDEESPDDSPMHVNDDSSKRVIYDSWIRSSVYSLGSICLGSLVVALLQVLQALTRSARERRGRNGVMSGGLLWCMLQCVVDQLERLAEYINKWAFGMYTFRCYNVESSLLFSQYYAFSCSKVYIALYGYDYWTAGSKVYQLFQARGWSVIINDHLVSRFLSLLQLLIALMSGGIGAFWGWLLILRNIDQEDDKDVNLSALWHMFFWVGFALGVVLSNVLFHLISSAVDTIMVCFAEAPNQLSALSSGHTNAPLLKTQLANEMVLAWRQVYPNEFGEA
jgi:hypothetical protein